MSNASHQLSQFVIAEQRRLAKEFEEAQLAAGVKRPVIAPIPPVPVRSNKMFVQDSLPTNPKENDVWHDTIFDVDWTFNGQFWENKKLSKQQLNVPQKQPAKAEVVKAPKTKKVNYLEEPFINDLGQTIPAGSIVIAVSTGYNHSFKIRPGLYLGKRLNSAGGVASVVVKLKDGKQTTLSSKKIYPTL